MHKEMEEVSEKSKLRAVHDGVLMMLFVGDNLRMKKGLLVTFPNRHQKASSFQTMNPL